MIRYFSKLLIIIAIVCCIEKIMHIYVEKGGNKLNIVNAGVYQAILLSKQQHRAKKLIIGDSVCDQLYPCGTDNDSLCSLATNQGVTIAGYYFLLHNYLQINKPQEVILLIHPNTLQNDVNKIAYNYFIKPFYTSEYQNMINEYLMNQIHSIPYYWISQLPGVVTTSYTPVYNIRSVYPISKVSEDYLDSLHVCCQKYGCIFSLHMAPISVGVANDYVTIADDIKNPMVLEAFRKIEVYPDSFYLDGNHFKRTHIPKDYLHIY